MSIATPQPGDPCLSIRQPWAWLITRPDLDGAAREKAMRTGVIKTVENRSWPTKFRGHFWIHAGKGCTAEEYATAAAFALLYPGVDVGRIPKLAELPRGAIVGSAELWDCKKETGNRWHIEGCWGLCLRDVRPLAQPITYPGALGFFKYKAAT